MKRFIVTGGVIDGSHVVVLMVVFCRWSRFPRSARYQIVKKEIAVMGHKDPHGRLLKLYDNLFANFTMYIHNWVLWLTLLAIFRNLSPMFM